MKLRHQLISQASVFVHQHTIDDLRDMVGHASAENLMQRLQRYAARVKTVLVPATQ